MATACRERSNFLKVNVARIAPRNQAQLHFPRGCQNRSRYTREARTTRSQQKPNYELFNRNNFNIRYWSWNYRGCWHQTCPPIDSRREICDSLIPKTKSRKRLALLYLVTTSLCQNWVICAPAAFLRRGSCFSGSLSGTKP